MEKLISLSNNKIANIQFRIDYNHKSTELARLKELDIELHPIIPYHEREENEKQKENEEYQKLKTTPCIGTAYINNIQIIPTKDNVKQPGCTYDIGYKLSFSDIQVIHAAIVEIQNNAQKESITLYEVYCEVIQ